MSKVLCEKSNLVAIADSVRSKTGTTGGMKITEIPQKIEAIETGGNINLQEKALTITSNGTTTVTPDTSYDALSKVDVTVNVVGGGGSPTDPYIEYTSLDSSGRVFTAKFRGTVVPEYAFAYLAELTSVDMPDNVIAIGDNGFYRCPKLQLASLPPGITSLGDFAFSDCSKLALTSLPSGITSIGDQAFRDCFSLALTSLPSGITSLPTAAFQYCPKLALTTFPSGMTSIGTYAFRQGTGLASITLPPRTHYNRRFCICQLYWVRNGQIYEHGILNSKWSIFRMHKTVYHLCSVVAGASSKCSLGR